MGGGKCDIVGLNRRSRSSTMGDRKEEGKGIELLTRVAITEPCYPSVRCNVVFDLKGCDLAACEDVHPRLLPSRPREDPMKGTRGLCSARFRVV